MLDNKTANDFGNDPILDALKKILAKCLSKKFNRPINIAAALKTPEFNPSQIKTSTIPGNHAISALMIPSINLFHHQ